MIMGGSVSQTAPPPTFGFRLWCCGPSATTKVRSRAPMDTCWHQTPGGSAIHSSPNVIGIAQIPETPKKMTGKKQHGQFLS